MLKRRYLGTLFLTLFLTIVGLSAGSAQADSAAYTLPYSGVLAMPQAQTRLDPAVRLFFGPQQFAPPTSWRHDYFVDRSGNALFTSAESACRSVLLDNLVTLQDRARAVGANAVVNIVSDYSLSPRNDSDTYQCHVGNVTASVSLKGTMVTLPD